MGDLAVRTGTDDDRADLAATFPDHLPGAVVVGHGTVYTVGELPVLVAERDGRLVGELTYVIGPLGLEVVTVNAREQRAGVGSALLAAAAEVGRAAGADRLWLITTNDNLDALRFYQRRGLRIVAVSPGAVDAARAVKPSIPVVGEFGIPIHDELTLAMPL